MRSNVRQKMNSLQKLQEWYIARCDGLWEHSSGIRIVTLDNPGWRMTINLADTEFETMGFTAVDDEKSEDDWIQCWKDAEGFQAAGGPRNLEEMIGVFLRWKEQKLEQAAASDGDKPPC